MLITLMVNGHYVDVKIHIKDILFITQILTVCFRKMFAHFS